MRKRKKVTTAHRRMLALKNAVNSVSDHTLLTLMSNMAGDYRIAITEAQAATPETYRYRHNDLVRRLRESLRISLGIYE